MEWLLALAFLFGLTQDAQVNYEEAALAAFAALEQQETAMYVDNETAKQSISSEWTVFPEVVSQGDAVMVRASVQQSIEWNGVAYELLPFGTGFYAILPVPIEMEAGTYQVGESTVTVVKKSFKTQQLKVTEEQEGMKRNTKRIQADREKILSARSLSESSFLFQDLFVIPLDNARLTTPYGFTRYTNGVYSGRHRAIDLAAPQGTPIAAAAAGKVTLSEELYLTGNTIYIDHGMGLFSEYAHLSELLVEPGEVVEAGQTIGLVGTTGFSTGPHLHFAFWIHNVQTNPDIFFDSSPFRW